MKLAVRIVVPLIVTGAMTACIFDPERCRDDPSYDGVSIPPTKNVASGDAAADALVVVGTKEEWLAMSCEDACRRARVEGLLGVPNATTSCSFETDHGPVLGEGEPWLRCNYVVAKCTKYE